MSFYSWREAQRSHVVGFLGKSVHYSKKRILGSTISIFWLTRVWDKVCSFSRDSATSGPELRYSRTKGFEWMANVSSIDCERRAGRWVRYRSRDGEKRRTGPDSCLTFESMNAKPLITSDVLDYCKIYLFTVIGRFDLYIPLYSCYDLHNPPSLKIQELCINAPRSKPYSGILYHNTWLSYISCILRTLDTSHKSLQ